MLTTRSTVSKNVLLDSFTVGPLIACLRRQLNVTLSLVLLPQNSPWETLCGPVSHLAPYLGGCLHER